MSQSAQQQEVPGIQSAMTRRPDRGSDDGSYISGARVAVTGGRPIL